MGKFKVGEEVKVRDDLKTGYSYYGIIATAGMVSLKGKKLTITYIKESGIYKVAENSYGWSESMLEKVEENKGYFEVGDIIKGVKNGYRFMNQDMYKGGVVNIHKDFMEVKILKHRNSHFVGEVLMVENSKKHFEYYNEPKNKSKDNKFNIGDKVKWKYQDGKFKIEYITQKEDIRFESKLYLISCDEGFYYCVPAKQLELIKEPKFEIGQEVRYSLYSHSYLIKDIYYDEKTNIYKYVVLSKRDKSIRLFDEMNLKSIN